MASLFPSRPPTRGGSGPALTTTILSFRAGRCILGNSQSNGKFLVTPDLRKGTLSLVRGNMDGMLYVVWTDRTSGRDEERRMLFPHEMIFRKVKTGVETDRVYKIHFTSSTNPAQSLLFWMQDKSGDKDEDNCAKLNQFANDPAAASAAAAEVNAAAAAAAAQPAADMDPMMRMLLGLNPGAVPPGAAATGAAPTAGRVSFNPVNQVHGAGALNLGNLDLSALLAQLPLPPAPTPAPAPAPAPAPVTAAATTPAPAPATVSSAATSAMDVSVDESVPRVLFPATPAAAASSSSSSSSSAAPTHAARPLVLSDAISADGSLHPALMQDHLLLDAWLQSLPDARRSESSLLEVLRSNAVVSALSALGRALHSSSASSATSVSSRVSDLLGNLSNVDDVDICGLFNTLLHYYPLALVDQSSGAGGSGSSSNLDTDMDAE